MESTYSKAEELATHVKEYIENRVASVKLSVAEKSSKLIANIIAAALTVMVFILFVLFTGIALAYAFAKLTGEYYWGFLIVAGIYLFCGALLWMVKEKLLRLPIMNAILSQLFKEEDDEQDQKY